MKVAWFLSLLMFTQTALAYPQKSTVQPFYQDWDRVKRVAVDDELMLKLKDGRKLKGRMASVTDSELQLSLKKQQPALIKRDDIQRVWHMRPSSKARKQMYAGIGGGIGFVTWVGVALSRMETQCGKCTGENAALGAGLVAGLLGGALLGYKLGGRRQKALIYQSP